MNLRSSIAVVVLCCALLVGMSASANAQKPKKPTFKKATIGSVAVVPPSGKKAGSIGGVEVKTLLAQTSDNVIGLTGNTRGTELEFAIYETGMESVITSWIDGWTAKTAVKQIWEIQGSSRRSCFITTMKYAGFNEDYGMDWYDNTFAYVVVDGKETQQVDYGISYGLYRHDAACSNKQVSGNGNFRNVSEGSPYFAVQMAAPDNDYGINTLVCLGTGDVLQLDNTYTSISVQECSIIGMICYMQNEGSDEKTPVYFGQQCEEGNIQEYFLIDPKTGASRKL